MNTPFSQSSMDTLNRLSLLSNESLSVAEDLEMARLLWEDPDIGDLAAEEFLGIVQAARERFRRLLSYPVIGMDFAVSEGEAS